MTIDREMLAAYAEGQLDEADRAAVEAAIVADPALAREVAAHRALKARLQAQFAPVMDLPVPDRLLDAVRSDPGLVAKAAKVVDLDTARAARVKRAARPPLLSRWITGGAIAASLALGLFLGTQMVPDSPIGQAGGQLVAQGPLDTALTGQLASTDPRPVRVLLSFRDSGGRYCRVFDATAMAGLACRDAHHWTIDRMQSSGVGDKGQYSQASSALGEIMAMAQSMAPEGALDHDQEKNAMDKDWR